MLRIQVVDSHTAGEPTRVVVAGGPDLGDGSLSEQRERFRANFDAYRRAIVCEPRGSDAMVGALLCAPMDRECVAGVVFFNNVGYLGMCGHGTMGVVKTLAHLGRLTAGCHLLETPVGRIPIEYDGHSKVSLENVRSFRLAADISVQVEGVGEVTGDIAWGGNWFFLVREHDELLDASNIVRLTDVCRRIRHSLGSAGITGDNGKEIDHIELFGPPTDEQNDSRNFVLCPGGAYDRSPCGTGTSAKIACLASDGKLQPGEVWRQESILGTVFEATYRREQSSILPRISGQAHITAEATLLIDDADPLAWGIGS